MINANELRDLIKEYGSHVTPGEFDVLYGFGIWYADKINAGEVVLSDWTPLPPTTLDNRESVVLNGRT